MKYAPIAAIPEQAADDINGVAIPAQDLWAVSVQVVATGSASGTAKIQVSNDNPVTGTGMVPTNWTDLPSATVDVSGAGAVLIPKTEVCYQWLRVVYANSGTGTIAANMKVSGF